MCKFFIIDPHIHVVHVHGSLHQPCQILHGASIMYQAFTRIHVVYNKRKDKGQHTHTGWSPKLFAGMTTGYCGPTLV